MPAPPARNREGACQPLPERIRPRPHAWREELVARLPLEGNVALAVDNVDRGALLPLEGNVLLAGLVSRQGAELGQRIHPEGKGGLEVARATAQLPELNLTPRRNFSAVGFIFPHFRSREKKRRVRVSWCDLVLNGADGS